MQVRFLKFSVKNVRDFGNLEISLVPKQGSKDPYRVSLVQMPNGTGKTTTHKLLAWALTGHVPTDVEVMEFKPTKFEAHKGSFEVLLSVDDHLYAVRLELDYDDGTARFRTSRPDVSRGGLEAGHNLPIGVKTVVTEQFARLFIFDGELAKEMLDRDRTEAEGAIKSLYFLDRLDGLNVMIDAVIEVKRAAAEVTNARTDQGLKILRTQVANARETERTLKQNLSELERELGGLGQTRKEKEDKLKELRERFQNMDAEYSKRSNEIKAKSGEIEKNAAALLQQLARPSQFSLSARAQLSALAERMATLKLPRTTSAEFFAELTGAAECICGTQMNEQMRVAIRANAEHYLSEDITATMNAIKHSIRGVEEYHDHSTLAERITALRAELALLVNQREALKGVLDEPTRIQMKELDDAITELTRSIDEDEFAKRLLTEADTTFQKDNGLDWKDNLPLCQRKIGDLNKKVSEAARTVKFEKQAELLKRINAEVAEEALQALKQKLVENANKRIRKILHNKDVVIDSIDKCLILEKKRGVSEGQTLAVAYAFLSTLFEDSPHRVPFVVDSPAVSLDIEVRREVSELLPALFDQLVVFILSSEREGFLEGIERGHRVLYSTVFKDAKVPGEIHVRNDRDFFVKFQSEEDNVVPP